MKHLNSYLIIMVTGIVFFSCTKTITPTLNNNVQLVIVGAVSDTVGPYHVNISKTAGFYTDNVYPTISGASVMITDVTTNLADVLTETEPGNYITHTIIGKPGDTYQLTVVLDGKTYNATSTMPQPVKLDSVGVDYDASDNIRPIAEYQDPLAKNYYKYAMKKNGIQVKHFQTFDDRLSNGRFIRENLDCDTNTFHRGDKVLVSLVGIDEKTYNFLRDAENVAYNNSNLAAPATPRSNITGGCVGYFSAQTVSSKTGLIK